MENITNESAINRKTLNFFTGSDRFFRHPLVRNVIFTEGCAFLCDNGSAWLIDAIASMQRDPALTLEEFQSWKLSVNRDTSSAILIATDGGAREDMQGRAIYKELFRQEIPFTDFPLAEIQLYCCANGEGANGKTILLPSEY